MTDSDAPADAGGDDAGSTEGGGVPNVLDAARDLLATGPLCDHCLGRPFAERSFGLGNHERGRGLRVAVALADDADYEPGDAGDCWVCEGVFERLDEFAERAADAVADYEFATYQVGTRVPPLAEENDRLLREDAGMDPDAGEPLRKELNREVGKRVGRVTGTEVDFDRPHVQFLLDVDADRVEATVNSAHVYGRYRKLERDIPQTEWPCSDCRGSGRQGREPCDTCDGSGYLYPESVEQLTAPVVEEVMEGVDSTFHGAGREDVDALMLGTGRPFVIEVDEPRRREVDVERLEADINAFADGKVEVEGLRRCAHDMVERVKELDATKRYRASVEFADDVADEDLADAVDALDGATIEQYTPNRVDHRRAAKTRTRVAHEVTADREDARHATVEVHGAGGLYIKELISGDEGRTEPSLAGLLGVDAAVTALDVLVVEGRDEPFEDSGFFLKDGRADGDGGEAGGDDDSDDGNGDEE
ncbi:tRNA pseudouridine(54/55) synthase Pus10 [Halobaculum sp. CBA1158]|uniref:tRNA pseudouridine(54/55) synthase Pus10 n=1 Tax=Halobaculum sp. CBA1158 TaxID=2904243 RepID=UPI001F2E2753|nr:tRNA pseudouridine(54/55) synthase Pus10 [Halobaculum sp. CBA1158]UIO99596.1 tRNA pseudouridine(54/55) synthase Pus10 [Halobaculum sp. CBA1158]